jgi:exopolysaccharide biosynthesis polyprenyl glycosylphosphotransferase
MQVHQLLDACLFAVSFWLAYVCRTSQAVIDLLDPLFPLQPFAQPFNEIAWLLVILIPAAPLILEAQGFYERPLLGSRFTTAWQLLKGCTFTAIGLIIALFLARTQIARWIPLWFIATSFILVYAKEEILRLIFRSDMAQARMQRRFVLVGTPEETARMRKQLRARSSEGMEVLAELDLNQASTGKLKEYLHEYGVNGVILSAKHSYFEHVESVVRACELEGVEAWLVADFFTTQISRTTFDDFFGRPVLVFRTAPEASWQSVLKQVIDFVGALVLLLVCAIPLLLIALLIRVTSPGPVLFRQQRSGLNGRPFTIYKFRTMVTDAEQRKHELESMNEMTGPVFKMTADPRITPLGRILRKFSLDEFPQLLNVLKGEMSLVGPRPLPVDEVKRFNDLAHRRRLSVKPGLTCLWQISGRNDVKDFKDWVRLDLEYIDNWSLWLDLKILWCTVPVVLAGTGAK